MKWNILYYILETGSVSGLISLFRLIFVSAAISVNRLLALLLGLRYRHFVTLRRVCALLTFFWLTGFSIVLTNSFWNGNQFALFVAISSVALSTFISIFSCTLRIFFKIRQQQARPQDLNQGQPNGEGIELNIARYKKTVSRIVWVQLALVLCYGPLFIAFVSTKITGWSGMSAGYIRISAGTLLYLNWSLNPILYCWKTKEVRQAVKDTVRKFSFSSS